MTVVFTISDEFADSLIQLADLVTKMTKNIKYSRVNGDVVEQKPANVEVKPNPLPSPTEEEVKKYVESKGYKGFNVARFIEYYESKGWKTKSGVDMLKGDGWKRTLDSWMSNGLMTGSSVEVGKNAATGTVSARSAFAPSEL